MKFGCSIGIFLNSAHLICRTTDISKRFRESLRLRDNESRLYVVSKYEVVKENGHTFRDKQLSFVVVRLLEGDQL